MHCLGSMASSSLFFPDISTKSPGPLLTTNKQHPTARRADEAATDAGLVQKSRQISRPLDHPGFGGPVASAAACSDASGRVRTAASHLLATERNR